MAGASDLWTGITGAENVNIFSQPVMMVVPVIGTRDPLQVSEEVVP